MLSPVLISHHGDTASAIGKLHFLSSYPENIFRASSEIFLPTKLTVGMTLSDMIL